MKHLPVLLSLYLIFFECSGDESKGNETAIAAEENVDSLPTNPNPQQVDTILRS